MNDMTDLMREALTHLRDTWPVPQTPNEIGIGIGVEPRPGSQYRSRGPGSIIAPALTALRRRGLVDTTTRRDMLTGSAYLITEQGKLDCG